MKILLIGNGFDIGNNLKTKPNDFMQYVKENDTNLYNSASNVLYQSTIPQHDNAFWHNIEHNLEHPSIPATDPNIYEGETVLPSECIDQFTDELNSALKRWIETVENNLDQPCMEKNEDYCQWISEADMFINFNYTSTLEKLYSIQESKDFHIHGSFNGSSNGYPQIGHKKVKDIPINDMFNSSMWFPKGTNEDRTNYLLRKTEKHTRGNYTRLKDFLENYNDSTFITDIYSIGLSFSKVDCDYLRYMNCDNLITEETYWHIGVYTNTETRAIEKNINAALKFEIDSNHFETNDFS